MKRKGKLKIKNLIIVVLVLILIIYLIISLISKLFFSKEIKKLENFNNRTLEYVKTYFKDSGVKLNIVYEYNYDYEINTVINQNVKEGTSLDEIKNLEVIVSKGMVETEILKNKGVNELGKVPIMMYHGIHNVSSSSTAYVGGNVDKDGYNRTSEAFRSDLEKYYQLGYRMIRLVDYVNGDIDVELGYSPIVLTFDDGKENNIRVTGLDSNGEIIIDPNSAVGILEEFKKKYPDYNVTATFFVNISLFDQSEYNEEILKWLVGHGYDIGNHTENHNDLATTSIETTQKVIANIYKKLDEIIPLKYVNIIALPFGNPTKKTNENYKYILEGSYNNYSYKTIAALRVGWEPENSPFNINFDKTYIKRCRAYDNNGKDFDIDSVFKNLEKTKYVSDGLTNIITIREQDKSKINTNIIDKKVITY